MFKELKFIKLTKFFNKIIYKHCNKNFNKLNSLIVIGQVNNFVENPKSAKNYISNINKFSLKF